MAIPKNVSFVTFDVYGTLIDWDTGAFEAFSAEAERDGFTVEREELLPLFHEIQQQIEAARRRTRLSPPGWRTRAARLADHLRCSSPLNA